MFVLSYFLVTIKINDVNSDCCITQNCVIVTYRKGSSTQKSQAQCRAAQIQYMMMTDVQQAVTEPAQISINLWQKMFSPKENHKNNNPHDL